ncbi:MAG: GNAT family N-acetyltransferase [Methanobacterium sp. BRmetb2]|jgi:ribosomal protein S18 acetylase RimI-like enzyme|nr:MAG: GNAT family N-acetyltransferase [Methanobacterium sp. BRmetb2]
MVNLTFIDTGSETLDLIQPLWEKLNEHHLNQKSDFNEHYANFTFQDRKEVLLRKSHDGDMFINLAEDKDSGLILGYCITTLSSENGGEIYSIYVEEKYRSLGIGSEIMKRALKWMDEKGVNTKKVVVGVGNQKAMSFYEGYGFHPRSITLEQTIKPNKR